MAVHPSSVIDTQIDTFDSALYTTITDKEEYCYDSSTQTYQDATGTTQTAGVDEYQPFFQSLSDAIVAWLNTSRNFSWDDYWQNYFSYIMMYKMYGTNPSLYSNLHADLVFDMDGYLSRIKNDPVDYYDDYYYDSKGTPTDETDDESGAPNLEADTATVNGAVSVEETDLDGLASQCTDAVSGSVTKQLFQTIEPTGNGPYSKRDMWDFIFEGTSDDLNYKYWLDLFGNSADVPETDPK